MTPRDEISMRQMLDHAVEASRFASGKRREDLDTDRLFHLAMTRLLEIVGEAAGRVSLSTREQYPQIAWPQIVGLRNRLIHGYDQVDCDILWLIAENDIPMLIADLEEIIGKRDEPK
jgi:uncharacterized protein with HEPN domain